MQNFITIGMLLLELFPLEKRHILKVYAKNRFMQGFCDDFRIFREIQRRIITCYYIVHSNSVKVYKFGPTILSYLPWSIIC